MKKITVGVLSVLMMLGCVFLASCGSKVTLSCDVDSVEIYTNDQNADNYLSADVSFSIENSSSGAYVEVSSGTGLVTVSSPTQKSDGSYSFKITATGSGSGDATVKITALDSSTQTHDIMVSVKTKVETVTAKSESTTRTNRYVVKGDQSSAKGTDLSSDTYLSFAPLTANVADVSWEIINSNSLYDVSSDGQQLLVASGGNEDTVVAEILNGKLYVYSSYGLDTITLQASCNGDASVSTTIDFSVINDSSIVSLTAEGNTSDGGSGSVNLITDGAVESDSQSFEVKFNGETDDKNVTGKLKVQSSYDVSLALAVYRVSGSSLTYLGDTESENFLLYIETKSETDNLGNNYVTFSYTISAENISSDTASSYAVFFVVEYDNFDYSVSTDRNADFGANGVRVVLNAAYVVTGIELSHTENGAENFINNDTINVYSSYSTVSGYLISTILLPYNVELDDNTFTIQIDVSASGANSELAQLLEADDSLSLDNFLTFTCNGRKLVFSRSNDVYVCSSSYLTSGSVIYVLANSQIPTSSYSYEGLKVDFIANSDANRQTSVYMNLFSITSAGSLESYVKDEDGLYVSSSSLDSGSSKILMRVYGITSATGLSVDADENSHFTFSSVKQTSTGEDGTGTYVDISFTVTLSGTDFEDEVNFTISHVTGKVSETYTVIAFVPLTSATIINASSTSSGVYDNTNGAQGYSLSDSLTISSTTSTDTTLTRLYVEAGTALSLTMTYQTLAENGVTFEFLLDNDNVYTDDLTSSAIDKIVANYSSIRANLMTNFSTYLTITTSRLTVTGGEFRGFVFAYFTGYDSSHQEITKVRIFEIVSFYGVDYLSSSVRATSLKSLETLSERDVDEANVSVTVSLRLDGAKASHLELSYFAFSSTLADFVETSGTYSNGYYEISNVSLDSTLTFKITALSTLGAGAISDRLTVFYDDSSYGITRSTYISLSITDVVRVETVEWVNETEDSEIYLNLTSSDSSEKTASIITSVGPSSATNTALTYVYAVDTGSTGALNIVQNSTGTSFTLSVASGTSYGSVGTLYILPQDMVKVVNGTRQILYYTFVDNDNDGELDDDETLTANYISMGEFGSIYSYLVADECTLLSGSTYYANFFVNLDGEKVYYSDFLLAIKVTLADGLSEETAIRIYNATQFKAIDTTKFYEIMNDITLSGWTGFSSGSTILTGMIFGNDSSVTITMTNSQMLISELAEGTAEGSGTIKNLTFAGNVTSSETCVGFIVGTNRGTISGVTIDVTTTNDTETIISSSKLTATGGNGVGGIVGINYGTVENSYVMGVTITAKNSVNTGGIVGMNYGTISGCGVEFYNFSTTEGSYSPNSISGRTYVGGIAGYHASNATIYQSYAYAHVLADSNYYDSDDVISGTNVGLFVGHVDSSASISESFAFLGDLTKIYGSNAGDANAATGSLALYNSYYSYYNNGFQTVIYNSYGVAFYTDISNADYDDSDGLYSNLTNLSSSIWATGENKDVNVNFTYYHLLNVSQTLEVDVNSLSLSDVTSANGNYQKLLSVDTTSGILFSYKVTSATSTSAEAAALSGLNTISIADMFKLSSESLTERQARSLVISSSVSNVTVSTTSIQINNVKTTVFTLKVLSKVNLSNSQTFSFVILENMPSLVTTSAGESISDGQTLLLQTGTTQNIAYTLDKSIYLNGTEFVSDSDTYSIELGSVTNSETSDDETYLTAELSGQNLVVTGKKAHSTTSTYTTTDVHLISNATITNNDSQSSFTQTAINTKIAATEKTDVSFVCYDGATALYLSGASSATLYPSGSLGFNVVLVTDSSSDNILMSLSYQSVTIIATESSTYSATFEVDDDLTLEITWVESVAYSNGQTTYRVVIRVSDESLYRLTQGYEDLELKITAKTNSACTQTFSFVVGSEEVEDVKVYAYQISNKLIRNSKTYYTLSTTSINTLSPASDAILTVLVTPAYAQMEYFEITYSSSVSGALVLSRLAENSLYGFYATASNVTSLSNGIRVTLTSTDRAGSGIYYFRLYVLSTFDTDSDVELTVTFYNNGSAVESVTYDLAVDYLASATVLVNGDTSALLAKGGTATISITVDVNTTIGTPYLQNVYQGIYIINTTETVTSSTRTITATLQVDVDASLQNGDTGVFYVSAMVSRTINGVYETKVTSATVYLVDFALATDGVKLSTGTTATYNGTTYDAYYSYVGATGYLTFDYTFNPDTYGTAVTTEEEAAITNLKSLREQFENDGNYADKDSGYYINYKYDSSTGELSKLSIEQTLSYVNSDGSTSKIYTYNSTSKKATITQSDYFSISTTSDVSNAMQIVGKATTGSNPVLMMMTTTVFFENTTFEYYYYFLIVVQAWTDEENPTEITDQVTFQKMLDGEYDSTDFILMNDIELDNYTPSDTTNIDTFDGNGYVIHLNSFAEQDSSTVSYALFDEVTSNTTLKNVKVNVYEGGQISIDYTQQTTSYVAGFAITNNGIIYNCEVVSYKASSTTNATNGIVVEYTKGEGTDPVTLNDSTLSSITTIVAGFVITNNSSITNSRVGGEELQYVKVLNSAYYLAIQELGTFTITGQGDVAGFVYENTGAISSSFVKNVQINNMTESTTATTAGFATSNTGTISSSYVEGTFDGNETICTGSTISAFGIVGGFIYSNSGTIKNAYSNIEITYTNEDGTSGSPTYVAGFVYRNESSGSISTCYTSCKIDTSDSNQMYFSGISTSSGVTNLNLGTITNSYYLSGSDSVTSTQTLLTSGVQALTVLDISNADENVYGFSFTSSDSDTNGIWQISDHGISIASANNIAISNRYSVTLSSGAVNYYYNSSLINSKTLRTVVVSLGSANNPIIIRSAEEFAKATGKATDTEISSYKQYYTDTTVSGNYRLVMDIDMSEIDQNTTGSGAAKLTTVDKTFTGTLDGNGFTISNISLQPNSETSEESFGLFEKLYGAVVMNVNFTVDTVSKGSAYAVGTLAGIAIDTRLIEISISPVTSSDDSVANSSIVGGNIVGGVVGILYGDSVMSNVSASDISVYSSYYDEKKSVSSNDTNVEGLLDRLSLNALTSDYASKLSYAGSLVGFVSTKPASGTNNATYAFATYSEDYNIADYSIVSVKVTGSVYVYGEVVGGLFGYVGATTYIYDASLELDSDYSSYIISKNLYAGGLVGESYGALFGVYAQYDDDTQAEIEEGENSYYSGSSSTRGQEDIFSHKRQETDMPQYIGGIAGYMGGGYIDVAYSKLNVISSSAVTSGRSTIAGGIVGLVGTSTNSYPLEFAKQTPEVNVLFLEVYASGDVWSATGVSGGIIGQINSSIVAMKNVMAMNYYSYSDSVLNGDEALIVHRDAAEGTSVDLTYMKNHSVLVGTGSDVSTFYVISETDEVNNVVDSIDWLASSSTTHTTTVGGYNSVTIGSDTIYLRMLGFTNAFEGKVWDNDDYDSTNGYYYQEEGDTGTYLSSEKYEDAEEGLAFAFLIAENISTLGSLDAAYVQFSNYFLDNGWSVNNWTHSQDELFPHLDLTKAVVETVYWDATVESTQEVIDAYKSNKNVEIIVRGKTSNSEFSAQYADINVTALVKALADANGDYSSYAYSLENGQGLFSNFSGTLISYAEYVSSTDITVNAAISDYYSTSYTNGTETKSYNIENGVDAGGSPKDGESSGDTPGLILTYSLFGSFSGSIVGLNIYYCSATDLSHSDSDNNFTMNLDESATIGYSLVANEGGTQDAEFSAVNLVLNHDVEYSVTGTDVQKGILGDAATSSSVFNVVVKANKYVASESEESKTTTITNEITSDTDATKNGYFGVLFGSMIQSSATQIMYLNDISVEGDLVLKVSNETGTALEKLYVGSLTGYVTKNEDSAQKIYSYIGTIDNITIEIDAETATLYVGGSVGYASALGSIRASSTSGSTGVQIYLNANVTTTLYAGLAYGEVASGSVPLSSETFTLSGAVYQKAGTTDENDIFTSTYSATYSYIGGLAGASGAISSISSIRTNLTVASAAVEDTGFFATSLESYSDKLNSFTSSGNVFVGGIFGQLYGSTPTIETYADVSGTVELYSETNATILCVGGLFGQVTCDVTIAASISNTMNVSVDSNSKSKNVAVKAYVGGVIGWAVGPESGKINVMIDTTGTTTIQDNTLANVANLIYGGAIGYITSIDAETGAFVTINNFVHCGALRVWGNAWNNSLAETYIYAGGVVGQNYLKPFDAATATYPNTISNCLTYGDVFVIYGEYSKDKYNDVPDFYYFGGIMASGAYYNIYGNVTLMSNFNTGYASSGNYVGAITGTGADDDGNFYGQECKDDEGYSQTPNYYSSSVNMTYQAGSAVTVDGDKTTAKNVDLYYGTNDTENSYVGYFLNTYSSDEDYSTAYEAIKGYSTQGILSLTMVSSRAGGTGTGSKLSPLTMDSDDVKNETYDYSIYFVDDTSYYTSLTAYLSEKNLSSTNSISWIALASDVKVIYSGEYVLFEDLSNMVFVGNGFTLTITDSRDIVNTDTSAIYYGGVANTMGAASSYYDEAETISIYNFQAISGLVVEISDESYPDITNKDTAYYGGVTGKATNGSVIYGVSVSGEVSVGGYYTYNSESGEYKDLALYLAGMVGYLDSGMITDSYSDANISYRAGEDGTISAIANVFTDTTATIKNTYASGLITDYVDVATYTFAYSTSIASKFNVVDSYSITQTTFVDISSGEVTKKESSANFISSGNYTASGTYTVINDATAISYSGTIFSAQNMYAKNDSSNTYSTTYYTWEYAPFVNYGYASHPIGWLKNMTAYISSQTNQSYLTKFNEDTYKGYATSEAYTSVVREYSYDEVTYYTALTDYLNKTDSLVLGVFDVAKFEDMVSVLSDISNSRYTNFVLEYDLDMSSKNSDAEFYFTSYGCDLGTEVKLIYIDGNNRTLDFGSVNSKTSALFGTVYGTIENLRITDITVSGSATLAETVSGASSLLSNITVTGNLTASGTTAGGVVAVLTDGALAVGIEGAVNVTSSAYTTGGVFGEVSNAAKVKYSSNSGQVISKANYSSSSDYLVAYKAEWEGADSLKYTTRRTDSWVDDYDGETYTYNLNEATSVTSEYISGYSYTMTSADDTDSTVAVLINAIAGGVVGYLNNASVSDSYNANSVLANYTTTSTSNSVAGGIVGYAVESNVETSTTTDEGGNEKTTTTFSTSITNCVNVALVGAGNYSSEASNKSGYSVAGGIFGYGYNLYEKAVDSCTNDGAVQAIGKQENVQTTYNKDGSIKKTGDWEITVLGPFFTGYTVTEEFEASTYIYSVQDSSDYDLNSSKRANMDYYAYKVGNLNYYYTLKYNPGDYRHVYAFGIGYVYSQYANVTKNCATSSDNIENDGNIGEYWVSQTMTFDRQAVLDNEYGDLDFWGKFNVNDPSDYTINGYDAYGFPVRIYNTDTISRVYMYTDLYVDESNIKSTDASSGTWTLNSAVGGKKTSTYYGMFSVYKAPFKYIGQVSGYQRLTYYVGSDGSGGWGYYYSSERDRAIKETFDDKCSHMVYYNYYPYVNDIYDSYAEAYGQDDGYLGWAMYVGTYTDSTLTTKGIAVNKDDTESVLIFEKTVITGLIGETADSSMWEDILMEDESTYYASVSFDLAKEGSSVYGYDYILSLGGAGETGIGALNAYYLADTTFEKVDTGTETCDSTETYYTKNGTAYTAHTGLTKFADDTDYYVLVSTTDKKESVSIADDDANVTIEKVSYDVSEYANSTIETIDAYLENSTDNKTFSVGGEIVAIAYSSNGLQAALAPYEYTIKYTLDLDEGQTISNVTVSNTKNGSEIVAASTYSVNTKEGSSTIELEIHAYCNAEATGGFSVTYQTTSSSSITLGSNNVTVNGTKLIIEFADERNDGTYDWISDLSNSTLDENFKDAILSSATLSSSTDEVTLYNYYDSSNTSNISFKINTNAAGDNVLQITLSGVVDDSGNILDGEGNIIDENGDEKPDLTTSNLNGMTFTLGVTTVATIWPDEDNVTLETKTETQTTDKYLVLSTNELDESKVLKSGVTISSSSGVLTFSSGIEAVIGVENVFSISYDGSKYTLMTYDTEKSEWESASSYTFDYYYANDDAAYVLTLTQDSSNVVLSAKTYTSATSYTSGKTHYSESGGEYTAISSANISSLFTQATSYTSGTSYSSYYLYDSGYTAATSFGELFTQATSYTDGTTYYLYNSGSYTVVEESEVSSLFETATEYDANTTYYSVSDSSVSVATEVDASNYSDYFTFVSNAYTFTANAYTFNSGYYTLETVDSGVAYLAFINYVGSESNYKTYQKISYSDSSKTSKQIISGTSFTVSYICKEEYVGNQKSYTYLGYTFYGITETKTITGFKFKSTGTYAASYSYTLSYYDDSTGSTASKTTTGSGLWTKSGGEVEVSVDYTNYETKYVELSVTSIYTIETISNKSSVTYKYDTTGTTLNFANSYSTFVGYGADGLVYEFKNATSFDEDEEYYKLSSGSYVLVSIVKDETTGNYIIDGDTGNPVDSSLMPNYVSNKFYVLSDTLESSYMVQVGSSSYDENAVYYKYDSGTYTLVSIEYDSSDKTYTIDGTTGYTSISDYYVVKYYSTSYTVDDGDTYTKTTETSVFNENVQYYKIVSDSEDGDYFATVSIEYDSSTGTYTIDGATGYKSISGYYYISASSYSSYEVRVYENGTVMYIYQNSTTKTEISISAVTTTETIDSTIYIKESGETTWTEYTNKVVTTTVTAQMVQVGTSSYNENAVYYKYDSSSGTYTLVTIEYDGSGTYTIDGTSGYTSISDYYYYVAETVTTAVSKTDDTQTKISFDPTNNNLYNFKFYVVYLDESNIIFNQYIDFEVTTSMYYNGYVEEDEEDYDITLIYDQDLNTSVTFDDIQSIKYKLSTVSVWTYQTVDGEITLTNNNYGSHEYEYITYSTVSDTLSYTYSEGSKGEYVYSGTSTTGKVGYKISYTPSTASVLPTVIIFGDDIHTDKTYSGISATIIGNGMLIKYTSESWDSGSAMFGDNSTTIKGLSFVAMVSLRDSTSSTASAAVVEVPSATTDHYLQVTTYGTIRNVFANQTGKVYTVSSGSVKLTETTTSYVSVIGLDDGVNNSISESGVAVELIDLANGFSGSGSIVSHSIIIAGDGANGTFGADGTPTSQSGSDGNSGKDGGSVTLQTSGTTSKYTITSSAIAREGTGGVAGSGGNGLNGFECVTDKEKTSYNYGVGGSVEGVNSGNSGGITGDGSELSVRDTSSVTLYSGNSGIGRFWRVYWEDYSDKYYSDYTATESKKEVTHLSRFLGNSSYFAYGIEINGFGGDYEDGAFYRNGVSAEGNDATNGAYSQNDDSEITWRRRYTDYWKHNDYGYKQYTTVFAGVYGTSTNITKYFNFSSTERTDRKSWKAACGNSGTMQSYFEGKINTAISKNAIKTKYGASEINFMFKASKKSSFGSTCSWRTSLWAQFELGNFTAGTSS